MTKIQNSKKYDLEERTLKFAKDIRKFLQEIPKSVINVEDIKQLLRSSGSVGANYIEANESLSKKDFVMRVKICRKEAKETEFWLNLMDVPRFDSERRQLLEEAIELRKIFGAIIEKSK